MPPFSLKIFIPAAGMGERLRPITNHIPKPLLPILGRPLIEIILERVSEISSGKIGINLHYRSEDLRQWILDSSYANRITFFHENPLLGTGGALKNAEDFLSDGHFLVYNSDILSDVDCVRLIETHLSAGNIATLAVHDYQKFNNLLIDENGFFKEITKRPSPTPLTQKEGTRGMIENTSSHKNILAFTGIAVYSPEILKFLPNKISHATIAWIAASKSGHKIQTLDFTGCYWKDIGTPASYASAIIDMLRANGETVYIHPSVKECSAVDIDGYIVIERESTLTKGSSLRNCIMLQGSTAYPSVSPLTKEGIKGGYVSEGGVLENCIIGPDFKIDLSESEMMESFRKDGKILIGTGGSDRKYYRIKNNTTSSVLMECRMDDPDFIRHIEYSRFLSGLSVPVPELLDTNTTMMKATFEDLGDISLYSWLKCRRSNVKIEAMYCRVVDIAVLLHTKATERLSECSLLHNRIFDYDHFRWETDYFLEKFVKGVKKIRVNDNSDLQDELHRIALKADSFKKTLIHRDFQSQNIMITKEVPRLIDYQGMRIGPPAYDIASILWDPYYRLEDRLRDRILKHYLAEIKNITDYNEKEFMNALLLCRLQRHMQALGAYGFLSYVKGKRYFLKHVPEALRLLKEDTYRTKKEYPALNKLVSQL